MAVSCKVIQIILIYIVRLKPRIEKTTSRVENLNTYKLKLQLQYIVIHQNRACTYKNTQTYIFMPFTKSIYLNYVKCSYIEYILDYYRHTSLIMPLEMKLLVKQAIYIYGNWFKTYICNYFV